MKCCCLKGCYIFFLVFLLWIYQPLNTVPRPKRQCWKSFFFFFPFFHEDNMLNVKNFYFRTVRQVAQEQFFLMCTRCCMGHRPLLFFITLLFTVLGVRHFKNMLIIVIHSYTRNSQEFMVLAYIKVRAVYIYLINISNCPYYLSHLL